MHCERLLALIRKMLGKEKSPDAERVCAVGLLGQLMSAHKQAGGMDPTTSTRAELLAMGAPLVTEAPENVQRPSAFFVFKNGQQALRKAKNEVLPGGRQGQREEIDEISRQWHELPPERRAHFYRIAKAGQLDAIRAAESASEEKALRTQLRAEQLRRVFWSLSSAEWP